MSFTVENLEKNMAKLTIEVPADEFEKALQKAYEKQKGKITLNGFRKGKAPRAMIEKIYGAGIFYEDAANIVIPDAYEKAADECEIDIVSQPEIDVTQVEKGKDFIFTATVAVKPEVTLGKYLGVEVEKTETKVLAADVNAELDRIREQNARIVDVTDRAVKSGDQTVIDFEGFIDGVAFDGGKGENYPLTIGSHSFIDTFEDQIIGANIGDEIEVNVTFPEDYQADNLAGKPAMFKVTVKSIKEKELPAANDDFAKDVSEFDTLAEYKADLKKTLTEKKKDEAAKIKKSKAVEKVVENATMDIPEPMVKSQVQSMVTEMAQRLQMQGVSLEQYMQYMGTEPQQFMMSLRPEALLRIKNSLVLDAVVEAEKITVSDADFEEELNKMASMYSMEVDKIKEMIGEDETEQIKKDIAIQKAADLIASKAVEVAPAKEEKDAE
ncbi:MAG: trigger factor [Butyrivibrio sp.]|nr:trigger factor [Butyrivibrio sp.]